MQPEEERFVHRMGRILAAEGLPPVAGRMWAWLLVCDPPEQTAEEVAAAIGASRGSISGAGRMLEAGGLIERTRRSGGRRELWSAAPDAMIRVLDLRERQLRPTLDVLDRAIDDLADRGPASLSRLHEARDLYALFARAFPALVDQYKAERAANSVAGVLSERG